MAPKGRSPRVDIKGTQSVDKAAKQAEGALTRLENHSKKSVGHLTKHALGYGAALVGAGGVVAGLEDSVKAAEDAQVSQAKLDAQLKAVGISYKSNSKQIDEVVSKTAAYSGFLDKDLTGALANIVRSTGDLHKSYGLLGLAADVARAKNIDVASAGQMVGRVYAGNVRVLKSLGIAMDPVTAAQDKLKASTKHATDEQKRAAVAADKTATAHRALGLLQQKLGGQAKAFGDTTAGSIAKFHSAVDALEAKLGSALAPTIADVATKAAHFVTQMRDGTGAGGRFADKMKQVADAVGKVVGVVKDVAGWLGKHPALLAAAGSAWVAYKTAALAQIAIVKAASLGLFGPSMKAKLGREAESAGSDVGKGFAAKAGLVVAAGVAGWEIGKWLRKDVPAVKDAGDFIGNAFGKAVYDKGFAWVRRLALGIVSPLALAAKGAEAIFGKTNGHPAINSPQVRDLTNTAGHALRGAPHTAPKKKKAHSSAVVPPGAPLTWNRIDQGQDLQTSAGGAVVASGDGKVIMIAHDPGGGGAHFGPSYPVVHYDTGPMAGRDVYYGHTVAALPAGAHFKAGDVIAHTGHGGPESGGAPPGWVEIGYWPPGSMTAGNAIAGPIHAAAGQTAPVGSGGSTGGSGGSSRPKIPVYTAPPLPSLGQNPRLKAIYDSGIYNAWYAKQHPDKPVKTQVDRTLSNPWLTAALGHVDNMVAAGLISEADGSARKTQILNGALNAPKGLVGEDRLVAQGMIRSFAPAAPEDTGVADENARLSDIDLHLRAGDITEQQAHDQKVASIDDALANWQGLSDPARLELRAERGDLLKENTQSVDDLAQAMKDLKASIDAQKANSDAILSTSFDAAIKALADVISGQIAGVGYSGRALTAGAGSVARY